MYLPQAVSLPQLLGIERDLFRCRHLVEEVEQELAVVGCSVEALRHVWQHRALLQEQQQHSGSGSGSGSGSRKGQADPPPVSFKKQRWETEAFDLLLAVFVDGPVSYRGRSRGTASGPDGCPPGSALLPAAAESARGA